jgi:TPR repeat protein
MFRKLVLGKKQRGLTRCVRTLLVCFALPFSVMAGHSQNVDELEAVMAEAQGKCSSNYLPHRYRDYRECDAIADVSAGAKCADEVARENRIIWRWNSFVRNCQASDDRTSGVPPPAPQFRSPSSPAGPAPDVTRPAMSNPTVTERPPNQDSEEVVALIQRARKLAEAGDIAAARLVLQRAAEAHSAQAALALGGMYDPIVLKELHIYGVTPDVAEARNWYKKAIEYGSAEASQRLQKLVGRQP